MINIVESKMSCTNFAMYVDKKSKLEITNIFPSNKTGELQKLGRHGKENGLSRPNPE